MTGLHVQPLNEMVKLNLYDLVEEENVFASIKESISRTEVLLKEKITSTEFLRGKAL